MAALIFGLIGQPFEAHAANLRRVSQVLGTTIAGPGRVQLLYFPTQPAKVAGDVYRWLRQGRLEQVFRPTDANMMTMDSVGPAELFFVDADNVQTIVYPEHYLVSRSVHGKRVYQFHYVNDTVTIQAGSSLYALKSPPLYRWLRAGQWKPLFQSESYTHEDILDIAAVMNSHWRSIFYGVFPSHPGVQVRVIRPPRVSWTSHHETRVWCTMTTQTVADRKGRKVIFQETWNNGQSNHIWAFPVTSSQAVSEPQQFGAVVPQFWQ